MKRITNFYVLVVLAFATGIVSCKKETASPANQSGSELREAQMGINPVPIETYPLLTKHGLNSLTYYSSGKLKSRNNGAGMVINYTYPTQFPNLIIAKESYNGSLVNEITYQLDASGLCKKMMVKYHLTANSIYEYTYEFTYQNSRLVEQKATKGTSDRYVFSYDAQNRLQDLNYYGSNGSLVQHTFYQYESGNAVALTDKYPINPKDAWFDSYLDIFGKFSKHLPTFFISYKGVGASQPLRHMTYQYQFNAKGFVTNRTEKEHITGKGFQPLVVSDYQYNASRGTN